MGNHLPISNPLWDLLLVYWPLEGQKLGHKEESKVHYRTRRPKATVLCQSHKVLAMVSGCCITTSPSGCSCLLWPCATLMHELTKPSLTQCTLIKHTAPHGSPLCCILSQSSSKPVSGLFPFQLHLMVGKVIQGKLCLGSLHSPFVKSFPFSGLWRVPEAIIQVSHSVSNLSSASEEFVFKIGLVTASFPAFLYPWDYFPQRHYLPVPQVCWSLLFLESLSIFSWFSLFPWNNELYHFMLAFILITTQSLDCQAVLLC